MDDPIPIPTPIEVPILVLPLPQYDLTYRNLRRLLSAVPDPHYENSWNGDILSLLNLTFPPTSPECYVIKPQSNLREPFVPPPNQEADNRRTSTDSRESHGAVTAHNRAMGGTEPNIERPDFVIDHGLWGRQKMVAMIELKRTKTLTPKDYTQFQDYCYRVTQFDDNITAGTSAMLIVGGVAYVWNRDQLGAIANQAEFTEGDIRQAAYAVVDTPGFLQMLAEIRNRFVESLM
ncbi:hypothetical protein FRC08_003297 [Ceratobasidium sp. 394]|nr:hypothetical protein FRC08_003297 [Ceratobasidium sp. 394]